MKVIEKALTSVPFKGIEEGEVFRLETGGTTYLKIEDIDCVDGATYNAVLLESGSLVFFREYDHVYVYPDAYVVLE